MSKIPNTRAARLRERESLWQELEKIPGAAGLVYRLKAVQFEIDNDEVAGDYTLCQTQEEAIFKFLEITQEWTPRIEIGRAIINGGFNKMPGFTKERAASYIGDKAYRMAHKDHVLEHIDKKLIGLPGWPRPEK